MEEMAALAGVSKITVSRALRDSPSVTPQTRERIKALAEQAGYRFNHSARNLRLRRSHTIAVALEMQPGTPAFSAPADGAIPLGQGVHGSAVKAASTYGLPLVVWGAEHGRGDGVVAGSDNQHGGACAAERFLRLGRKELLFLGDIRPAELHERLLGFQRRLYE